MLMPEGPGLAHFSRSKELLRAPLGSEFDPSFGTGEREISLGISVISTLSHEPRIFSVSNHKHFLVSISGEGKGQFYNGRYWIVGKGF